jgi:hypothetical protein
VSAAVAVSAWMFALTVANSVLLGRKNRLGWLSVLALNATWVLYGPWSGQWPLGVAGVVFGALAVRNYRRWAAEEQHAPRRTPPAPRR